MQNIFDVHLKHYLLFFLIFIYRYFIVYVAMFNFTTFQLVLCIYFYNMCHILLYVRVIVCVYFTNKKYIMN